MPNRLLPEHGSVWILAILRYPAIYHGEGHFLEFKTDPSYRQFSAESGIIAAEAPKVYSTAEFFGTPTSENMGLAPYGQWYRYHPPRIHHLYQDREGYPFLEGSSFTKDQLHYCQPHEYSHIFQTDVNGEWEFTGECQMNAMRNVPAPITSIFAGTD